MLQQNITYLAEGWSPGPNGEYSRKEATAVQTLDGLIQALRYLHTVQQYKCFTVSTRLLSIQEMMGEINEVAEETSNELEEAPQGDSTEIQA